MAKVLDCGEIFPGCQERITGATEQEVMTLEAEHARRAHGLSQLGPDLQRRITGKIRNRQPEADALDEDIIALGIPVGTPAPLALVSSPLLAALQGVGTVHVYGDTADGDELGPA